MINPQVTHRPSVVFKPDEIFLSHTDPVVP